MLRSMKDANSPLRLVYITPEKVSKVSCVTSAMAWITIDVVTVTCAVQDADVHARAAISVRPTVPVRTIRNPWFCVPTFIWRLQW